MNATISSPGGFSVLVVPARGRDAAPGAPHLLLQPGQTVQFRVLPANAAGETRIRIDRYVLAAVVQRPIPVGSTGTAVVKRPGPPIVLQLLELSMPPHRDLVRIPVLTGKEPLRGGPFPASSLERWNEALRLQYPPGLRHLSPDRVREGILLTRFLSGALAIGIAGGEKTAAPLRGFLRKEADGAHRETRAGSDPENVSPDGELGAPAGEATPRDDVPFWFFLPTPGERAPVVFPGHRRKEAGEKEAAWGVFLRIPDLGAVSVRFRRCDGGWRVGFSVEHETLHRAISEGAGELAGRLREAGFPLRDVTVRRMPKGQIEAEVTARMSRDLGFPLLERRA